MEVEGGKIKSYPGGLDYYLDKREEKNALFKEEERLAKQEEKSKKQKEKQKENEKPVLTELQRKHQEALKRIAQIKIEIKQLEKEAKELELESYAKSRALATAYENRDQERIKEYGQRLKWIQTRLREIESIIKNLTEEKNRISR